MLGSSCFHQASCLLTITSWPIYRLGEELGRGAYGVVYRGMDMRTGTHVAIKQLSLDRIPQDSLQVGGG